MIDRIYRLASFGILLGLWIVFSGKFDLFHLTLGVISAGIITHFSGDMFFHDRTRGLEERKRELSRLPGYLVWLVWQIILANLHVLYLALHPRGLAEVEPTLVRFHTPLRSAFAKYVLANSITLTPGTITLKTTGNRFVVHAISLKTKESLDGSMDRRIADVFGEKGPL